MQKLSLILCLLTTNAIAADQQDRKISQELKRNNELLISAVNKNKELLVQEILKKGNVDVDARDKDKDNSTSLMLASYYGYFNIVKLLLASMADVNAKDDNGVTVLMLACMNGNIDLVKFLIENGAKVNVQDDQGYTPLLCCFMHDNIKLIKLLVSQGAKISDKDKRGHTAIKLAILTDVKETLELLKYWLPFSEDYHKDKENNFMRFKSKVKLGDILISELSNIVLDYLEPSFEEWILTIFPKIEVYFRKLKQ